jgi:DNA recombination protein RmuC
MPDLPSYVLLILALSLVFVAVALLLLLHRSRSDNARLRAAAEETKSLADRQAVEIEHAARALQQHAEDLAEARQRHGEAERTRALAQEECARLQEAERRLESAGEDARQAIERLTDRHDGLQRTHAELQSAHAALQADTDGKLASAEREVKALKDLRDELSRRFEELANATLRRTSEDFSRSHAEKLNELLTPFREHVGRFEAELRNVHKSADEERARLGEQIRQLTQRSEAISVEATNLTRALKGDKQRQGAWGEMILEGVLEASGLIEGLHYDRQKSHVDDEGARWRPDVVVRMPRGKCLVIDSKVSLVAYEAAVSTETEEERIQHLKAHVTAVRRHIDTIAAKGYAGLEQGSVDYVLMFMPIEGALSEAWRQQGDLTSYAVGKGVGLVTPTTLMLALKTVDHIWTVERREQNAEAIADRAGKLYDKVEGFVSDMQRVGSALATAGKAHADAMGKLTSGRGNLLSQVDKLKAMGARTIKDIGVPFEPEDDDEGLASMAALPAAE